MHVFFPPTQSNAVLTLQWQDRAAASEEKTHSHGPPLSTRRGQCLIELMLFGPTHFGTAFLDFEYPL